MLIIEIEGAPEAIIGLNGIKGIKLQSGLRDLGGGRVRASAVLASADLVPEIEARSLVVRVTMDESEIERRGAAQREAMRRAFPDREPDPEDGSRKP